MRDNSRVLSKRGVLLLRAFMALAIAALCVLLIFAVYKNYTLSDEIRAAAESADSSESSPPADDGLPVFAPYAVDGTRPYDLLYGTRITVDGELADGYEFEDRIDFDYGYTYQGAVEGVLTFRGNNLRDTAVYGTAELKNQAFGEVWTLDSGSLKSPDGEYWSGSGWTGQALIAKWPAEVRAVMDLYDWAKQADELVEVIYPALDGNIYFAELETGRQTRDTLTLGYPFEGCGSLDPRGYPILYIGAGYDSFKGLPRVFAISLVDSSVLYEFGDEDPFALGTGTGFTATPLIDAETDRLIYPGENGILYIIKLGTSFNAATGELSVNPTEEVKWRYSTKRETGADRLGVESSPIIWRGHIIMADGGGNLMCINLNTLKLVWVRDVLDDTCSTPALELEDGHPYIYIGTSFGSGLRGGDDGADSVPYWKLDAVTGEAVWSREYVCYAPEDAAGGVIGTAAVGTGTLENLIFVPFARTPSLSSGILAALDKQTGEPVWAIETQAYSISSPVCVYGADGAGYIIYCTSGGYMYLLDGLTGAKLDFLDLGGAIDASPVVYGNTVVVGTQEQKIWGTALT